MFNVNELIRKDLNHIWHPCTQMKDFTHNPPLLIERAQGAYLYTNKGPIIDAISSWWCKSLGHGHPAVLSAIEKQLKKFEHVITANTTHPLLAELGEHLARLTGNQHVFFASDGACAVEIAMKLVLHARQIQGFAHKNHFIALKNAYHGETMATMCVSDLARFKSPYSALSLSCHFIDPMPYCSGPEDPLWNNCEEQWRAIKPQLERLADTACAILIEPIVQGAAGMLCYSPDLLRRLNVWAKEHAIYIIADEIMTGMGRTGEWLAIQHAAINPELICLSKGLTSGSIPLSCVMVDHGLFELFYADSPSPKSFLHSHTYSGNPLAVAAALATIKTMEEEETIKQAQHLSVFMRDLFSEIAQITGKLTQVRGIGAVIAADLVPWQDSSMSKRVSQHALEQGALLKPIGNTLYWLPPLNTDAKTIGKLAEITLNSIKEAYK